jgi:hypothetical protein
MPPPIKVRWLPGKLFTLYMNKKSLVFSRVKLSLFSTVGIILALALKSNVVLAQDAAPKPPQVTNDTVDASTARTLTMEDKIYIVESSKLTASEKVDAYFVMFAKEDWEGQRKIAIAALKLVDDSHYAARVGKYLLNPQLDPRVLNVFMTATLKRNYSIKLPLLLELAQVDGHPFEDEARELLHSFLQQDNGTNWVQWNQTMQAFLSKNPK